MTVDEVVDFLRRTGLQRDAVSIRVTPLAGGVSSDIVRVDLPSGPICVKRALPALKVAAEWRADVRRSLHEVAWLRVARRIVGGAVPEVLAADAATSTFAMPWFDPSDHAVWKSRLLEGDVTGSTAARIGALMGALHAATARDPDIARAFAHDADFASLRLDPYLSATARVHVELAPQLLALRERTAATRLALVHGDISPKNVLVGPAGPVLLDAECAWYGEPAFDLAFCLNHLLLKCLVRTERTSAYLGAVQALVAAYVPQVRWESWPTLESRVASLLPALLLARVDGLSPVEYLRRDSQRDLVRAFARERLRTPPPSIEHITRAWAACIAEGLPPS